MTDDEAWMLSPGDVVLDRWNFKQYTVSTVNGDYVQFVDYRPAHVHSLFMMDCILISTRIRKVTFK